MTDTFTIVAAGYGPLDFTDNLPPGLDQYFIPGSNSMCAVASFGNILLQLIELDGYSWLYSVFDIREDVSMYVSYAAGISVSHINLAGSTEHDIEGIGKLVVKDSRFLILCCPVLSVTTQFKKGRLYRFLTIRYPKEFMLRSLAIFPLLEEFERNTRESKTAFIPARDIRINAAIADKVYQLIHSPYSPNVRNFHFTIARKLLSLLLGQASKELLQDNKFSTDETQIIYAAKEFIDANLANHFFISEIAREVGINEKKLKKGFKETFGKGLFEYLLTERLKIAKIEIEQTSRPIKQISRHAGYKNVSNFSTAFKKMFGDTPLRVRNKYTRPNEDKIDN